jgi:hypothetical protein
VIRASAIYLSASLLKSLLTSLQIAIAFRKIDGAIRQISPLALARNKLAQAMLVFHSSDAIMLTNGQEEAQHA